MVIGHISDTARWVAWYRAMESRRPDAIFRDPFAEKLAGPDGASIVAKMPRGKSTAWAMITRTAVFDEIIMTRIREHGADLVLNLAAGLDARPWRLPLPPSLRWIDVDLPDILDYKTGTLRDDSPACEYVAHAADLTQPDAVAEVVGRYGANGRRALVVTEGLLVYLRPEDVAHLAATLAAAPAFRWWVIDLASPRLLKYMNRTWGRRLREGNAAMQFAPAEGTGFFEPHGWHELEFRASGDEAHRLGREMRMMWFWRFLIHLSSPAKREEFRRMAGYVLLGREPEDESDGPDGAGPT